MVNLRRQAVVYALFAVLASNVGCGVAFAQNVKTVVGKPRHSFFPNPLAVADLNNKGFDTGLTAEESVTHPYDRISAKIIEQRQSVVKTILGASIISVLISQRQFIGYFLSQVLLQGYKTSLVSYPLRTKVLTGATLAVIGDALAQMQDAGKQYDLRRACSFAAFDSCYRMFQHVAIPTIVKLGKGNVLKTLYSILPMLSITPKTLSFFAAMERTLLYQFGLIPFFYYPVFFTFTGTIQGLTLGETFKRAKKSFLPCWKRNLMFWIPTQLVMFGLIDENWQIPFACVMGILWSSILSITAGKAKQSS